MQQLKEERHEIEKQRKESEEKMDKLTEDPGAGYDEQLVDVEDEEDEDTDKDSTDDEKMFDEDDRSSVNNQSAYSNATSVCTSLELSDQAVRPRQEYPTQLEVGTGQQMTTEEPVRPHLASTFVDQQTNGMCQADTQFTAALSLEATFNRNSIPLCQRPYGAPIFMRVIHGDISGVYNIIARGEGSLWDHDPYGLSLLYEWRASWTSAWMTEQHSNRPCLVARLTSRLRSAIRQPRPPVEILMP